MRTIYRFFDRLEDKIRNALSRFPLVYGIISGIAIVSFWRGVWESSDILGVHPYASFFGGLAVLLAIGVLVTEFIGNRIIISGLRGEKKLEEKTLDEIAEEEEFLTELKKKVNRMEKMLEEISAKIK